MFSLSSEKNNNNHTGISILLMFFLMVLTFAGNPVQGQTVYTFSTSSSAFNEITGTTVVWSGEIPDDVYSNGIPIGFSFNFYGNSYSTVSVSTNGWLTFGQNITNSGRTNNLTTGGTRPLVAPLWDDLALQNKNDFSYTTEGNAGSRIFTAQWLNVKWNRVASGGVISFQVKLYESSGMIEFIYRQESADVYSGTASIGIAPSGLYSFYSVQNTTPSATVSSTYEVTNLSTKPGTGQVFAFTPSSGALIELDSPDPAVPVGTIFQNTTDNIIYFFECIISQADATITGLQITTAGTYTEDDISFLNAWYSDDATFSSSTDFLLSRKTSSLGPGSQVFPEFEPQQMEAGSTGYIFITSDLKCSSVAGRTISVNAVGTADVSFLSGTKTGLTYAGAAKTIQYAIPVNVSGPSGTPDGITADLSWNNPAGCYDEILIVGNTSSITSSPSGDGSSYTASTAYGSSGTSFPGGGYVLYKGITSPQTITNLLEGTTYYFKFFTRNGTNWSSGIEINISTSAASTGNFRSLGSGNWNSTLTWEYFNNGSWGEAPSTPTEVAGSISIRNGHTVTVTADISADQVIIDAGGVLSINNTVTFTLLDGAGTDCTVNGTLVNAGNITTTGNISFSSTGVYNHARDGGQVPTAIWNAGSICNITGAITNAPANLNQSFYNFTWNCTGQTGNISLGGYPSTIPGTFTVDNTGPVSTTKLSPGGNVTYTNYLQRGGNYSILGVVATARTINITNFTLQGGTLTMSDAGAIGTMNVRGNFTHSGGTITETSSGNGSIIFNGTSMQTYTSGGTITQAINLTVNPNAYLQMASEGTVIPGSGATFNLSASATLGIKSAAGINLGGSLGNIQTRLRNYNAGANYLYNGTGPQETGDAIIFTNLTGNVTVAPSSELTTTGDMTIDGSLTVNGKLIPGDESYVFDGTGTLNGSGIVEVNRVSSPADFQYQYQISNKFLSNLTIEYTSPSGSQIISPLTYGNLKLSNSGGINTLGGNVTVSSTFTTTAGGTLNVNSGYLLNASNMTNAGIFTIGGAGKATIGNLVNNGTLNLNSTGAAQDYSLIMDNYSGSGTANVSLYLTGGGEPDYKWHYVAVPATTSKSVFTSISAYDLMLYDESKVTTDINQGWMWHDGYEGTTAFTDMFVKKGYSFYHSAASTIVSFSGLTSVQTTLGTIPLAYSGSTPAIHGFNLLGNSLTCGIDWNLVTESGDVDNTVYYLKDYKEAQYLRNVGGINGGTKDIPPLQGFIVKANAAGTSLNFTNARQHTAQAFYKKSGKGDTDEKASEPASLIRLELNNLVNQDETLVWFSDEATNSYEGDFDARKFFGEGSFDQIFTLIGSARIGINGLPLPAESTTIPVSVEIKNAGTAFKIIASSLQGLDQYRVTLTDKYNSNFIADLKTNPEYSFSSPAGIFDDRFILTISNIATTSDDDSSIAPEPFKVYTSANVLIIELMDKGWEGKKSMITIHNLSGNKVYSENKADWVYGERRQFDLNIPKGMYIVEIKSENRRFVSKINLNL